MMNLVNRFVAKYLSIPYAAISVLITCDPIFFEGVAKRGEKERWSNELCVLFSMPCAFIYTEKNLLPKEYNSNQETI